MTTNQSPVETPSPSSPKKMKALHNLILTLLSPKQVRKLRTRYNRCEETIAELAEISGCPPVLLYCILTPLWYQTDIKLRKLGYEKKVLALRDRGFTNEQIAVKLRMPPWRVKEYGEGCFDPLVYIYRPWYHDKAAPPKAPNDLEYEECTLPPTARLGWTDGTLADIPDEMKGRCPECGQMVWLPCHECRVKRDMKALKIPRVGEFGSTDDARF